MNELQKKTQEWMQLERKTLQQRREAEQFYDEHLMALIEQSFVKTNRKRLEQKVDCLVISVGTSYEPIVLNLALTKPQRILFLYTESSRKTLDKVISYSGMEPSQYEKSLVHETDPMAIYREIKNIYLRWKQPECMYIDITGGTKAMSASAALAGAMINVRLMYVATDDYLVDFRKPNPGSEYLVYIENPIAVFGDLEMEKAVELFDSFNFSGAAEKFEYLKENSPEPDVRQQMNFLFLLARAYEAWDALEFSAAYDHMNRLKREIDRDKSLHPEFLLADLSERIHTQCGVLKELRVIPTYIRDRKQQELLKKKPVTAALMFTMQQNASTRSKQEKYDMAALLMYRLLEMIEQDRLMRYGLYVSAMDYTKIKFDLKRRPELEKLPAGERMKWLEHEVEQIRSQLFRRYNSYLPDQVSLLDGFVILTALGDPITEGPNKDPINVLKQIRSKVSLRNNSIFAHGLGPVGREDYQKFESFVKSMFQNYCRLESIDYKENSKIQEWILPGESANYNRSRSFD